MLHLGKRGSGTVTRVGSTPTGDQETRGTSAGCQTSIDCKGQGNGYDKDDPYYHSYNLRNEVCSTSVSSCTIDNVNDSLKKNAAPGSDGVNPVTENKPSTIEFMGIRGGTVYHRVDDENNRIINITQEDHVFYNGIAIRSVVEEGGRIYINTFGEGVNRPQSELLPNRVSWALNYATAGPGFHSLDHNIHLDVLSRSRDGLAVLARERQMMEVGRRR